MLVSRRVLYKSVFVVDTRSDRRHFDLYCTPFTVRTKIDLLFVVMVNLTCIFLVKGINCLFILPMHQNLLDFEHFSVGVRDVPRHVAIFLLCARCF